MAQWVTPELSPRLRRMVVEVFIWVCFSNCTSRGQTIVKKSISADSIPKGTVRVAGLLHKPGSGAGSGGKVPAIVILHPGVV
jgi:hypothetical protein